MNGYSSFEARVAELQSLAVIAGHRELLGHIQMAALMRDADLLNDIEQLVKDTIAVQQPELHPFAAGAIQELPEGDVHVGNLVGPQERLEIPLPAFAEHFGVFGTTGSGKTVLISQVIRQLVDKGIKVWVFDHEGDFCDLLGDLLQREILLTMGYRDVKRNICEPAPGEDAMEAINRLAALLRGAFYLRDGSQNMFAETLAQLYSEHGVLNGSHDYPCAQDVNERLQIARHRVQREAEYGVTLKNRFGGLVRSMGAVYECSRGFPLEDLLRHSIIWRLQGLDRYYHSFFVQDLLSWVMAYRERNRPDELTHVFVIDEIHRLVSGDRHRDDLGEPLVMTFARTTRKAGIGLIVADQVPGELPGALIGNLGTRVCLRLFHGPDVMAIARSMSLTREQAAYLPTMAPRRAVVHTKGLALPVLVEVPEIANGGGNG